jgi:hypothetical protein
LRVNKLVAVRADALSIVDLSWRRRLYRCNQRESIIALHTLWTLSAVIDRQATVSTVIRVRALFAIVVAVVV